MNDEELSVKLGRLEERVNHITDEMHEMKQDVRDSRDKLAPIDDIHNDVKILIKDNERMKGGMKLLAVFTSSLGGIVGFVASRTTDWMKW